jgi:Raf kinase inhibitor-like YbhB/YbcL family protein
MKRWAAFTIALSVTTALAAQTQPQNLPPPASTAPPATPLVITLPGLADGGRIPDKYTCLAAPNYVSPEIRWKQAPTGTRSFVLIFHDIEPRPNKGIFDNPHWILWNIHGTATSLPEGIPAGAKLADGTHQMKRPRTNYGTDYSYYPPCAPPGPNHHYVWELYALDTVLDLPDDASRADILKAADGHVLGASGYYGYFHRLD